MRCAPRHGFAGAGRGCGREPYGDGAGSAGACTLASCHPAPCAFHALSRATPPLLSLQKSSLAAPLAGDQALDGLCAALLAHLAPKRKLAPAAPRDAQTEELPDAEPQEYL